MSMGLPCVLNKCSPECMAETEKIKVLQIVEDLPVGGMERIIQSLAVGLPLEKYEVRVWCLTKGGAIADEIKASGISVEVLGMGPRCTLPFLWRLRKKIRACRVDILHAHGSAATVIGKTAGFLARVPVMISHVHSLYWSHTRKQLIMEGLLGLVTDKIICCSRAVADFVLTHEKVPPQKVIVVYNGAQDMRSSLVEDGREERLCAGNFRVGVPASLVTHKGHKCFLEAMKDVIAARPGVSVILAGDGPLRKELQELAEKLGIVEKVCFSGIIREMDGFYAYVDLVVLPSTIREGISVAILEAMSAGKAVVGTLVGGIPEAVVENETGLLVPPLDAPALAAAILQLIDDREMLAKMGIAGRARYEKKFTRTRMLAEITGIYEELLGR